MATGKAFCKAAACAVAAGLGTLAAFGATRVGVINWDCSPPSDTWFGGYQTRSLSPARYRYLTPYYADVKGPDEISYHRRTPAEYDRELQYAIDAGIDYFAYCWYGEDPHARASTTSPTAGTARIRTPRACRFIRGAARAARTISGRSPGRGSST